MADMPPLRAPPNLSALVKAAFTQARTNGDLTYYPTQVAVLKPGSISFQLRFSPALASKPRAPDPKSSDSSKKPFNPFEAPPAALLVASLPSHNLVLNKFAVVPDHFILATATVKPQTHVLEESDIAATYACIASYAAAREDLFAFFNSGSHSGASQPHRHLQLLPVQRMREGLEDADGGSGWEVLVDRVREMQEGSRADLPLQILTAEISEDMTPRERHDTYVELYKQAVRASQGNSSSPGGLEERDVPGVGEAKISYNFAMTKTSMALCPRVAEGSTIQDDKGKDIGVVSLNGTVLAGTALVKNEAEWDVLRANPAMLLDVLKQIGIQPPNGPSASL
ncbi:ATP adenylyltransferase-domain-containing protein [Xylariaceae sp. FL0016]|nr:ATP adenylyltransferase-domain-containing protein [Xylariaceae sp. FL0016]